MCTPTVLLPWKQSWRRIWRWTRRLWVWIAMMTIAMLRVTLFSTLCCCPRCLSCLRSEVMTTFMSSWLLCKIWQFMLLSLFVLMSLSTHLLCWFVDFVSIWWLTVSYTWMCSCPVRIPTMSRNMSVLFQWCYHYPLTMQCLMFISLVSCWFLSLIFPWWWLMSFLFTCRCVQISTCHSCLVLFSKFYIKVCCPLVSPPSPSNSRSFTPLWGI